MRIQGEIPVVKDGPGCAPGSLERVHHLIAIAGTGPFLNQRVELILVEPAVQLIREALIGGLGGGSHDPAQGAPLLIG